MDRTLYLVVRDSKGNWAFPSAALRPTEGLYEVSSFSIHFFRHLPSKVGS